MYQVEKNVPLPSRYSRYPFAQMEVGDSFEVPVDSARNAQHAVYQENRRGEKKFTFRKMGDVARCWRTA